MANLNKIENKAKRSLMGSSLINAAFNDVQKVNKVKSEYNAAPGNFIKAGQMFKCMDTAARLSTNFGGVGVGTVFLGTIEEDGDKHSVHSGMSGLNPLGKMMLNGNKPLSMFNFGAS